MLDFFAKPFAIAGIAAAAGPIIIHLLNRRRFRVVNWAAMDFLREALQRNRKILQMRDLILLVLRVLCVLLVGMALARPFFQTAGGESLFQQTWPWLTGTAALGLAIWAVLTSVRVTRIAVLAGSVILAAFAGFGFYDLINTRLAGGEEVLSQRHPVHAVLVLDNSLSMGYETLEGSLLDQAKAKAAEFIDRLPPESSVSVIPLCGSQHAFSLDAHRNKEDARDALKTIEVVDRRGTASMAVGLAAEASKQVPELPSKRVVFLGDQQAGNWPAESLKADLARLPELQVVDVSAENSENVWVSDFRIQDGIADIETPSTFLVTVESQGPRSLQDVQVALTVDGVSVASQTIDLEPKQSRLLEFQYQIDVPAEPGRPQFVPAEVEVQTATIEGDRLKSDNKRHLLVPVVAALPVVFVDQLGREENVRAGEVGETYPLRRYHAPRLSRDDFQRQLIEVRHRTIGELNRDVLKDARLVFVGGVQDPGDAVPLLRDYVRQGGRLVITAGAEFDPAAWQQAAWEDGQGILPAPLEPEPFGATIEELELQGRLDDLKTFSLDFDTMQHPYFLLEEMSEEELRSFYRLSFFFKAVEPDVSRPILDDLKTRLTQRLAKERKFLAEAARRKAEWEAMQREGTFGAQEEASMAEVEAKQREIAPNWLLWKPEGAERQLAKSVEQVVQESLPRVLARFDVRPENGLTKEAAAGLPFLVERQIGLGKVLFFTTGTYSDWNTLPKNINISLFDRIPRRLLEETLPKRQFETGKRIVIPAEPDQSLQYTLTRPTGDEELLTVDALENQSNLEQELYGLSIQNAFQRGVYQITGKPKNNEGPSLAGNSSPLLQLAVNGPADESDLSVLNRESLEERLGSPGESGMWRWIGPGESISLEGAQIRGRDYWKILIVMVLAGLVLEMLVLAWPTVKRNWQAASGDGSPGQIKEPAA